MENAAKALLIAGEVLIGVLLLSLFVYVFAHFASGTETVEKKYTAEEIQKINMQFTAYEGQEITPQETLTIIHLAQEYNKAIDGNKEANNNTSKIAIMINYEDVTGYEETDLIEKIVKKYLYESNCKFNFMINMIEYNQNTSIVNKIILEVEEESLED